MTTPLELILEDTNVVTMAKDRGGRGGRPVYQREDVLPED